MYSVTARGDNAASQQDAAVLADYFTLATPLSSLSQSWAADARFRSVYPYFQGKHLQELERPCNYIPALDANCSAAGCTCCAWDQQGMAYDTAGPSSFEDVVCGAQAGAWCSRSGSTDSLRSAKTHRSQTFFFGETLPQPLPLAAQTTSYGCLDRALDI